MPRPSRVLVLSSSLFLALAVLLNRALEAGVEFEDQPSRFVDRVVVFDRLD
jgi:hypothetical protein